MNRTALTTGLLALLLVMLPVTQVAQAQDERELKTQRSEAHKARSEERKQRSQRLADATRELRDYAAGLEANYRQEADALETAFRLREVELQAEHATRVTRAETEFQTQWTAALMGQGAVDAGQLQAAEDRASAYAEQLFAIRRGAAEELHRARLQSQLDKDRLRDAVDEQVLARARELGLTRDYAPILATPIGGELTRSESQWNQREEKEVVKIAERNARLLAPYRNGKQLREWERANLDEDFRLKWDEEAERQALNTQRSFQSLFLQQSAQGDPAAGQNLMARAAELAEQERLIQIRYEQRRRENAIKRRDEKKRLMAQ